jgi:sigma-B regulation protein RsbU (phosphoserine phosphatase)
VPFLSKLRRPLRLRQVTLALFVIVAAAWILYWTAGFQIAGRSLLTALLALSVLALILQSMRPLAHRLLWRLRNRLLATYLLFGAVPLALIFVMLALAFWVLCGQIAANMVQEEIRARRSLLYSAAHDLALTTFYGTRSRPLADTTVEFERDLRKRIPELRTIVRFVGSVTRTPPEAEIQDIPTWTTPGYQGLIEKDGKYMIAAYASIKATNGTIDILAYAPIDGAMLASFAPDVGYVELLSLRTRSGAGPRAAAVPTVISSARPLSKSQGIWDQPLPWVSFLETKQLDGGSRDLLMTVTSRPSLIIGRVFRSLGTQASALGTALIVIGVILFLLEIASLLWSLRLARTITGSVYDLYVGTKQVEAGDFSHRIPIRTTDQLSELGSSFNNMTSQIQRLVGEVKEKEKLQAELEIAHNVQTRLFPKSIPVLKTLDLIGMCNPARVVSGDYYDFVPVSERWTALVIGDISGKGISAALLMASMQSALRAQITAMDASWIGMKGGEAPSTSVMVSRLNRQLHESTSSETFASFFCAMYDDSTGRLSYTNAGHLPPILVRDGRATRLEVNGMVMGFFPDTPYGQDSLHLRPGDLFAAFTDGITESENADGEQFGAERLEQLLIENATQTLDGIIQAANLAFRKWAFDIDTQDDATMLLARRL